MPDVPSWITKALADWLRAAGSPADKETLHAEAERIVSNWNTAAHSPRHLACLVERLDELESVCADSSLIKLAASYRDQTPSAAVQLPQMTLDRLASLQRGSDREGQLLADARLSLLATSPQKYRAYLEELREDARDVPDSLFHQKRREFVTSILSRPRLFLTPFAAKWEPKLRENLEGELAAIEDLAGTAAPDVAPPVRVPAAEKQATINAASASEERPDRSFDDTSSLEEISDLFAHKKRNER